MRIFMYGFSGQNTNIWLEYFSRHKEHDVVFVTPRILPDTLIDVNNVQIITLNYKETSNKLANKIKYWYARIRCYFNICENRYDLLIYQGLYNWTDLILINKWIVSEKKILLLWNDSNHRRLVNTDSEEKKMVIQNVLQPVDHIYPTWEPVRNAFLQSFPLYRSKTETRPWGLRQSFVLHAPQTSISLDPDIGDALERNGKILLYWPRTLHRHIRHDILFDALELMSKEDRFVTVLAMGEAQNIEWDNNIISSLKLLQKKRVIYAEYSKHLPLSQIQPFYERADVLINLADSDQLSSCILEAFATKTRVILSDIPAYRELLNYGFSVTFVANNGKDVAEAIRSVIDSLRTAESEQILIRNKKLVLENFSIEDNISKIINT